MLEKTAAVLRWSKSQDVRTGGKTHRQCYSVRGKPAFINRDRTTIIIIGYRLGRYGDMARKITEYNHTATQEGGHFRRDLVWRVGVQRKDHSFGANVLWEIRGVIWET